MKPQYSRAARCAASKTPPHKDGTISSKSVPKLDMHAIYPRCKHRSITKNQTACGHPTLKDGVCFGPHARTLGFLGIQKSSILRCSDPLDRQDWSSAFGFPCVKIFQLYPGCHHIGLGSKNNQWIIDLIEHKKRAKVHFIPDLRVVVFVTLRAPDIIK